MTVNPLNAPFVDSQPAWEPSAEVTEHCSSPLPADADFFAPPPAEIGKVQSAFTTLKRSKNAMPTSSRLLIALAVGGVSAMIVVYLIQQDEEMASVAWPTGMLILFCVGLGAWVATEFRQRCDYVGVEGVAQFYLRGSRQSIPKCTMMLLFNQAHELRTGQTRHYTNWAYDKTTYFFNWTDKTGRPLLTLAGKYCSMNGMPGRGHPFHFAKASEIAWSLYLLDRVADELERKGSIEFRINRGLTVRVGPGFLEFDHNGEVAHIRVDEIKTCNLNEGTFHIAHKDTRWFSFKGKFNFSYASMPNARVFLLLIEKVVGISIV
jgi:hypothetical protein